MAGNIQSRTAPSVSVCIPTYNRPERLQEAVASVIAAGKHYQGEIEIMICCDSGLRIVPPEIGSLPSNVGVFIDDCAGRFEHLGAKRQHMLALASTDWVTWVDDDDVVMPWHLRPFLSLQESDQMLVWTDWFKVDLEASGHVLRTSWGEASGIVFAARRSALDALGGFNTSMDKGEDSDLRFRLSTAVGAQAVRKCGTPSYVYQAWPIPRASKGSKFVGGADESIELDFRVSPVFEVLAKPFAKDFPPGEWFQ